MRKESQDLRIIVGQRTTPESIAHLTKALQELPIRINRAILFGSRTRGAYMEHSDWDVVIVSEDFEGIPFIERISPILRKLNVSNAELFCYTSEEFEEGREGFGIIGVAIKEGVELIPGKLEK